MTHRLTDPIALDRNRRRAQRAPAMFLHQQAADDLQDRLSMVNKSFTDVALVSGFPDFWQGQMPGAAMVADAQTLPLAEGSRDLVVHAMALQWADDPVGQLVQSRLALRPDGLFLAVFFGGRTLHELRACLAQAESELRGGLSPRIAPMGELRDLGGLLQRAGFALPVADNIELTASYATPFDLMRDLRAMGEGNAMAARPRQFMRRDVMMRACDLYAQNFSAPDGRITATFDLIFLTGWAPDASQPKPLRPGSAAARLADGLGTTEIKLKD